MSKIEERILKIHRPFKIYGECGHNHEPGDGSVEVEDIGLTCEFMYEICRECCTFGIDCGTSQTEECASGHKHGKDEPICRTVAALHEVKP